MYPTPPLTFSFISPLTFNLYPFTRTLFPFTLYPLPLTLYPLPYRSTCPAPDPCPPGEGFNSGACFACTGNTFSSTTSGDGCSTHKTCGAGEGVLTAGTDKTDTVCEVCNSATNPNSFNPSSSNSACQAHQTCPVGSGKGEEGRIGLNYIFYIVYKLPERLR